MLKQIDEKPAGEAQMDAPLTRGDVEEQSIMLRASRVLAQILLMIAVLAGSVFLMNRLIDASPERGGRPNIDTSIPVQTQTVSLSDQRPTIRLFGSLTAARSVDLRPAVSGKVVALNPGLFAGTAVEEGEVLFSIERFDYEVALSEARANLAQTVASIVEIEARLSSEREQLESVEQQLDIARRDLARARQLQGEGTLTAKQLDDRTLLVSQREQAVSQRRNNLLIEQARLDQQKAAQQRLELGVERAERNLADTVVRAPFAGVVRSSTVEIGRIVSTNDVSVSMYDDQALDARVTLTDAQYGRVAVDGDPLIGRRLQLMWTVGGQQYRYDAVVTRIGADIASERGGVDVYARLEPSDLPVQIRPGAFVEVEFPDRLYQDAARIPETALYGSDRAYVVIDGVLEARTISVSAFQGNEVIISDGLNDGDVVLTTRLSAVEDGLKVRPAADAEGG